MWAPTASISPHSSGCSTTVPTSGLGVTVHGDDINKALRTFKRKILKAGILNEVHERQFFTKKSEKKRLAKSAGRQRWLKKLRDTPGPHQQKTNYRKKRSH